MKKDVSLNSKYQTKTEIANNCQEDNLDEDFSLVSEPEVKRQRKWLTCNSSAIIEHKTDWH